MTCPPRAPRLSTSRSPGRPMRARRQLRPSAHVGQGPETACRLPWSTAKRGVRARIIEQHGARGEPRGSRAAPISGATGPVREGGPARAHRLPSSRHRCRKVAPRQLSFGWFSRHARSAQALGGGRRDLCEDVGTLRRASAPGKVPQHHMDGQRAKFDRHR